MKITGLKISNFVEVKSFDLKGLTGTTLLTGENGVGKTTILNAISFAFGFEARDVRGIAIKNKELIGPNGDSASVTIPMEIGDRKLKLIASVGKDRTIEIEDIERKQPAFLGAKGIGQTYEALYLAMDVDPKHLECSLSPRAYLLGPDLGNILADLCAGEWTLADVESAAGEHWDYLKSRFFAAKNPDLESIGKLAFTQRTDVKKALTHLKSEMERIGDVECPESRDGKRMDESHIPVIQEALKGLQAQRDALIAEKARVEAGTVDRRPELEAAKSAALVDLEIAAAEKEKASRAYKESQDTLASASKALSTVKDAHSKAGAEFERATTEVASIEKNGHKCDRCGHEMTPDEFAGIRNAASGNLDAAKAALDAINLNEAKGQFDGFEQGSNQAREASHKATAEYDRLVAENNRIDAELERLGAAKPSRSIELIQTELESTEERIEVGTKKLHDLIDWTNRNNLAKQAIETEANVRHLDWAVAAFKEGEFLKSRLSGNLHVFEDACNEKLSPFGYSLKVVVDGKTANVWLQKGDHRSAPIARCSKAELVLAGYAVATAFAKASPICIDDMDAMFSETKSKFIAQLKARDMGESPIFASGAWTAGNVDMEPITKYLTNAKVVWVGKE